MKRMVSDVRSEKLAQELTDLETRGDDKLKGRWRSLYGTGPSEDSRCSTVSRAPGTCAVALPAVGAG